jgi:hypothetical protein
MVIKIFNFKIKLILIIYLKSVFKFSKEVSKSDSISEIPPIVIVDL